MVNAWAILFLPTGITSFKGQCIHSWEYKSPEKFQGKKIVVIGIGNSGVDVASELSHMAAQVGFLYSLSWDATCPLPSEMWALHEMCVVFTHTLLQCWLLITPHTSFLNSCFDNPFQEKKKKEENGIKINISDFSECHIVYIYQSVEALLTYPRVTKKKMNLARNHFLNPFIFHWHDTWQHLPTVILSKFIFLGIRIN